jgi:hypothetical protein
MGNTLACRVAYDHAVAGRTAHPLRMGNYKLRECRDNLVVRLETLERVREDRLRRSAGYGRAFGCCTSDDAASWIKGLPVLIAHELGYNIVPAIAALSADGVSEHAVTRHVDLLWWDVLELVIKCDAALRVLQADGIKPEYRRLLTGQSLVVRLLRSAMQIIDEALALVPPTLPSTPRQGCP